MAVVKNQFGTFETEKQTGTPRLPVTEQQEVIAQRAYGKNFSELTTDQRKNKNFWREGIKYSKIKMPSKLRRKK